MDQSQAEGQCQAASGTQLSAKKKDENNYYLDNIRHTHNNLIQLDESQIRFSWCQTLTAFTGTKVACD